MNMMSELMFGTYLFFLLCGVGMGLLVGYVIGHHAAACEFFDDYDHDDEDDPGYGLLAEHILQYDEERLGNEEAK